MTSTLRGVRGRVSEMLSDVGGGGLVSVLDIQFLFCFVKENWIYAMTRHHAEPNINILLTKNL